MVISSVLYQSFLVHAVTSNLFTIGTNFVVTNQLFFCYYNFCVQRLRNICLFARLRREYNVMASLFVLSVASVFGFSTTALVAVQGELRMLQDACLIGLHEAVLLTQPLLKGNEVQHLLVRGNSSSYNTCPVQRDKSINNFIPEQPLYYHGLTCISRTYLILLGILKSIFLKLNHLNSVFKIAELQ